MEQEALESSQLSLILTHSFAAIEKASTLYIALNTLISFTRALQDPLSFCASLSLFSNEQ